jgi:hypothetical protein
MKRDLLFALLRALNFHFPTREISMMAYGCACVCERVRKREKRVNLNGKLTYGNEVHRTMQAELWKM